MVTTIWPWVGFLSLIFVLLALDLGVFHRTPHAIRPREAAIWSAVWIALSLTFNAVIYFWKGPGPALEFLTGYLIEKALSVDNLFVFVLIFAYFKVPSSYQHRVLFWGILGALITRALLIGAGALLLARFEWLIYLFGAFLVYTGLRLTRSQEEEIHPEGNRIVRLVRRLFPVSHEYDGPRFFTRVGGRRALTPLFIVLVMVETTDIVFAVDSIPAIFGVTRDPFIVFTSNIFAILGLRALYFLLAGVLEMFEYLNLGLAVVLIFIGAKMLLERWVHVPIGLSLGVVFGVLTLTALASVVKRRLARREGGG
jgi:tellurite resistance protein TerC